MRRRVAQGRHSVAEGRPSGPADIVLDSPSYATAPAEPHRHHRRRRHRLQHRLPPRAARRPGRVAAGTPAADARRHLACGRIGGPAPQQQQPDAHHALRRRAVRQARGGNRAGHGVAGCGQPAPRFVAGALAGTQALGDDGQGLRLPRRSGVTARGPRPVSAAGDEGRGRRRVDRGRRLRRPDEPHQCLRGRRARRRRDDRAGRARDRAEALRKARDDGRHRRGARSQPSA